ncbi:hypothetical protein M8818_001139 [Zalaria obscura]|uniref:Uncharacterized protein n=1 Tax=Zalaria obscura TaxID=2024903 RepID=A0ACC3SMM8_9PEZI
MVFVKPTVHVSRFAGTALKSFTHGYAQTVVAASQSSYASQNTPVAPLANNFLNRFNNKSGKSQFKDGHHLATGANQANGSNAARHDNGHHDGLEKYFEAWQKHQKGDVREWQQFSFAKRLEWKRPSTVPDEINVQAHESAVVEELPEDADISEEKGTLKRAYTTSALDNFGKAIDNEAAEAQALAQVNDAIAEEISKLKQEIEVEAGLDVSTAEEKVAQQNRESISEVSSPGASSAVFSENTLASSVSEIDPYTQQLDELARSEQYAQIPAIFESMLRSGVKQPSQLAYRALLTSAIELSHGRHQKVPRALEVYSDMLRRKVLPDAQTYSALINILGARALDAHTTKKDLNARRARYGGLDAEGQFMFRSDELEYAIMAEDQSLAIALKIFNVATSTASLTSQSYGVLITACANQGRIADMLQLYEQMESQKLVPVATIFPAMISAFAEIGDLRNAVECYDEYKELAIANDAGKVDMQRIDAQVYSALIKAYGTCERLAGGQKFLEQIENEEPIALTRQAIRDSAVTMAFLPLALKAGEFETLSELTDKLSESAFGNAMKSICITAADKNSVALGEKAFDALVATQSPLAEAAMAMLAMHVRNANVEAAEPFWRVLESSPAAVAFIEPSTMRTIALIGVGQAARGLRQSRRMFSKFREAEQSKQAKQDAVERVDEAIEILGRLALRSGKPLQPEASVELLRMMTDNGHLVTPVAEHLVAGFGADQIQQLPSSDLELLTQVQARMILDESAADIAGPARFAYLVEQIVARSMLPDVATENLIEKTLINIDRSDLSRLWNSYRYPVTPAYSPAPFPPFAPFVQPPVVPAQPAFDDAFDPYAARTDNKGSIAITDMLEKPHGRSGSHLNEALNKFRNIRRVGRHPRFFTYAKLITAAAKENQLDLAHDILEMAKQDVPFLPQYRVVRFGWVSILDSMVAACLTVGRRDLAAKYHQDLLDMGAAPTANTYGLYITTLKENTKTFDEATSAVQIFQRAKSEGVEPSSFLYNALIGKLGKARRIDDCLFYFAEMRNLGVRPTSVTYGTIVNALCRVSDEKFAEEIFEEMESAQNYKPRPAPYHSLMQFFLSTKRDRAKVLAYYERMTARGIEPTMHTYKLLIDTHATLEPINMPAAEAVLEQMRASGHRPEAVHYSSLIHAKGCVQHDLEGARALFDQVIADKGVHVQPCLYQALFESLVANHALAQSAEALLADMRARRVEMTPYIANALIHGWTQEKAIEKAQQAFGAVGYANREPSTYEAMVRAYLAVEDRESARKIVAEALGRGYPAAVAGKIAELVGGGRA